MSDVLSSWIGVGEEAHLAVTVAGDAARGATTHSATLVDDRVASRIFAKDPTLWGPEAEAEAAVRLGWTQLHHTSLDFLDELEELARATRGEGKTRVVLCGMGGSSLGPEVICATYGVPLVTLDSTDPEQVRAALSGDLTHTIVVVSSKSGGTVETDSQRRVLEAALSTAGVDPRQHIVVVTDPGSPLEQASLEAEYRAVFRADPHVGGRFSVLSAFGLVPSALAGVPVRELLEEAAAVADSLAEDDESNPALIVGAAMAGTDRRTLVFSDHGSGLVGFADWAEQLIAESTGKSGVGVLPVVAEPNAPDAEVDGVIDVRLVALDADDEASGHAMTVAGTLGAQFLSWEVATAVAGRLLEIDPFSQPNVESAKVAARALLDSLPEPDAPAFVDGGIEVRATPGLLDGVDTVEQAVAALEDHLGADGYTAVMVYLDREAHPELATVRPAIARRTGRPATFGWGPRFLHSTGQLHKGGAPVGVFLQVTGTYADDLAIPGRPFTFGQLIGAQAAGDADVLADHDRPVLRLTLTDEAQVAHLRAILED